MTAYYNEFDPKAAAWLRELVRQGHIAPGDVDERSIEDVRPDELRGYTQCHFFAGIGVWSYALRRAGWPDDRPVWTGSCPCQPFSAAGKGGGFTDERHLWPHFHHLISECEPSVVLGEQVASKDGLGWFDLVQADLEGAGYASGAVDLCAAGVGAPHIRQRLWWAAERMADAEMRGQSGGLRKCGSPERSAWPTGGHGPFGGLGDDDDTRLEGQRGRHQAASGWVGEAGPASAAGEFGGLANTSGARCESVVEKSAIHRIGQPEHSGSVGEGAGSKSNRPSPTNGHWRDADWLFCRDGKWRPVGPGTFPLAHGAAERVGRLRGYGNAIVAPAAQAFVEAYLESETDRHLRLTGGIFG